MEQLPSDLLESCQDTFDYISLCDLATLSPSELVLLELPEPHKPGCRYRCMGAESLRAFTGRSAKRLEVLEEGGATGRVLVPLYLPGVDLEERDFDFLARTLEAEPKEGRPYLLHVQQLLHAPAQRVLGQHETAVHIYELAEAKWERELWALFDEAMLPPQAVCLEGHPLHLDVRQRETSTEELEDPIICDQCERMLVSMRCYTCGKCDFDICCECYEKRSGKARSNDAVAWLKEELSAFWERHSDFRLPPLPPRQGNVLSSAVTKWNGHNMPGDEKLELRAAFLETLAAHGTDVSVLLAFWPGCDKEFEAASSYLKKVMHTMSVVEWRQNESICAGATVTLGPDSPSGVLARCQSGRQWELEDGEVICLEAGSPRPRVEGDFSAIRPAWLATRQDALRLHAGRLLQSLGPAWKESWATDLLVAAACAAEAAAAAARARKQHREMVLRRITRLQEELGELPGDGDEVTDEEDSEQESEAE